MKQYGRWIRWNQLLGLGIILLVGGRVWGAQTVRICGKCQKWHKIELQFQAPEVLSELSTPNPFRDFRLIVWFTHQKSGKTYKVPGFFAADGKAADTGADQGRIWAVRFAPDETGWWTYRVSFRQGPDVAISEDPRAGKPIWFDGLQGSFFVAPSKEKGRDFRARGRLEYVGKAFLRFHDSGEYFWKIGTDAPENLLAYEDFDATPNVGGRRKSWTPHARDFDPATAQPCTWAKGKGTELLGALRYLAGKGLNAVSFLTFSLDGDDDNVFPHRLRVPIREYEALPEDHRWETGVWHDRFDVSKLDQWERIFSYADRMGLYLHFKLQEQENDQKMDGGDLGPERKLYYRELIARFAHHLALNWNLGEENTNTTEQRQAFARYFWEHDPYRHPIVLHTYPSAKDQIYTPLLGNRSFLTGVSLQSPARSVFRDTLTWRRRSEQSGKPWVVANDEQNPPTIGIPPDDADPGHDRVRRWVLWGNLMAGGAGIESYFGYKYPNSDLTCQDFHTRDQWWDQCHYAHAFLFQNHIPFWEMENRDDLVRGPNGTHCLARVGQVYVIYLPQSGSVQLDLRSVRGRFRVDWYDPKHGGPLQQGRIKTIQGGKWAALGRPPSTVTPDWVILVRR